MAFHLSSTILSPILIVLTLCTTLVCTNACDERDRIALLDFKTSLASSPQNYGKLSSWSSNENATNCCTWEGITCDDSTRRVVSLDLSWKNLTGTMPTLFKFQSLRELHLDHNLLERFAPHDSPLFPASLYELYMSYNTLHGILSDQHFANFSQLMFLDLTNNPNLTISFNEPPTQIVRLLLSSCNVGPDFPRWLPTLNRISYLDLSQSNISGSAPTIFWTNIPHTMMYLNLSYNNLHGTVPINFGGQDPLLFTLDLTSNAFHGPIPRLFFKATLLLLSKNNFSSIPNSSSLDFPGRIPTIFPIGSSPPTPTNILDISDNNLSGEIPQWLWQQMSTFNTLNLANNNLTGIIPSSIGSTSELFLLNLRNNSLFGQLPSWLRNCTKLRILDLSMNKFSGMLPSWLDEGLTSLSFLSLQSNSLMGTLPKNLCNLSSLRILDLSQNQLSGDIPSCVNNFVAMTHDVNSSTQITLPWARDGSYSFPIEEANFYRAFVTWKGMDRLFLKNLKLVKLIDLSNNILSGEIPTYVMSLLELDSLDLSSNNFHGSIPNQIGQLKSLEFLNMSYNKLSGPIPPSLSEISSLGMLDLSHNNLSGRIPKGTQLQGFDASSFSGNSELCGLPLQVKCPGDVDGFGGAIQPSATYKGDKEDECANKQCFYGGLGIGFAFGFLGIIATLIWISKWRYTFFRFASDFGEWILLIVAMSSSKISRKFKV